MPTRSYRREAALRHQQFGFHAWQSQPRVMIGAHVHTDIELNLFLTGSARYFLAGRQHDVLPGRLAVFWAGMPHRLIAVEAGAEFLCMTLPLGWFLGWNIGGALHERLLEGELVQEVGETREARDVALFSTWAADLREPENRRRNEAERIVLLEVEARLRRLARDLETEERGEPERGGVPRHEAGYVERIAACLSQRYREPLSVEQIGEVVGLNPHYAMTLFKQGSGLTIGEYLTRLRLSHAQRLLLTTDWTVERIALDCGFGSPSRFFAAFKQRCGCTPRAYRLRQ